MTREELDSHFEAERPRFLDEWKEFVRFPSVSTVPAHAADCEACADWLVRHLTGLGLKAEKLPTGGRPAVFASRPAEAGHPTVLLYGHYDVQPADPLALWASPPFAPEVRDGRLYGRGASDNKGQVHYALKAVETLLRRGELGAGFKVLLDGEEESGSCGLLPSLPKWRDRLRADVLLVCDTGTPRLGVPTLVMGLRGIVHLTVRVGGLTHDLHSGTHGGVVPNPAQEMARLVASLHNEAGGVAVAGFLDGLVSPTDAERTLAEAMGTDEREYVSETGVPPVGGEQGFTPVERRGFRPTIEVNGLHSGYGGEGTKTIIPTHAVAKLSARLVPGQNPEASLAAIERHLAARAPRGLRLEFAERHLSGEGFRLNPESPVARHARDVLQQLFGMPPILLWEGASIPVVPALARAAGADPLLVGFSAPEDRIHAPNESFGLSQYKQGYLYVATWLASL
jgi:acetylornithine deacetylase/succinyl-diaminopimelate desuccinylase-like protein